MIIGCNPIQSIHDQGAGGNGNVLKEIVDPLGAKIYCDKFSLGDPTIDVLELWGAEYQESDAILTKQDDRKLLEKISLREKCPIDFVGSITGDEKIKLIDGNEDNEHNEQNRRHPVDLDLKHVLGSMPRKVFHFRREETILKPLVLPDNLSLLMALDRVLRLPSVGSKRFLTNKVDRSVSGIKI